MCFHVAPWPKHPSDPGDVQFVHPGMHGHVRAPLSPSLGLPVIDQAPVESPSVWFFAIRWWTVMELVGRETWGNHRNQSGKRNQIIIIIKSKKMCVMYFHNSYQKHVLEFLVPMPSYTKPCHSVLGNRLNLFLPFLSQTLVMDGWTWSAAETTWNGFCTRWWAPPSSNM